VEGVKFDLFDLGDFGGFGLGAGLSGEVDGGDAQGAEEQAGALVIELVEGDAVGDFEDGALDGGAVFEAGQIEGGVGEDEVALRPAAGTGGVVVIAEVFAAERWAAAAVSGGVDVAAEVAFAGRFWLGCGFLRELDRLCGFHFGIPPDTYFKKLKSSKHVG
jgi:hypothetical protein